MKNLMQAYSLVKKYGHVIGEVIKLLEIVEESGRDKKLTPDEKLQRDLKNWKKRKRLRRKK